MHLPVTEAFTLTYWALGWVALALGLWFWAEVAISTGRAFIFRPKQSFLILMRLLGAFSLLIGILWIATAGDRP